MAYIRLRRWGKAATPNNELNQREARPSNRGSTEGARRLAQNLLRRCNIQCNFLKRRNANNNPAVQNNIGRRGARIFQNQPKVIDRPQRRHDDFVSPSLNNEVQAEKKEPSPPPPSLKTAMNLDQANHQIEQMSPEAKMAEEEKAASQPLVTNTKKIELQTQGLDANQVELKFIQESRETHIEAMILKLLKKAATLIDSEASPPTTAETIELVKNTRFIKHQKAAVETLERIAKRLENNIDLKSINIESELNRLMESKDGEFKGAISEARAAAIQSALFPNRIDKDDTELKNSIIVDSEGNFIALKNSVTVEKDGFEDQVLKDKVYDLLRENYDGNKNVFLSRKRTHGHPKKQGHAKIILGQGSFGKVRLGENVLTGESVAVKKMRNSKYAKDEFGEKQRLIEKLKDNPRDIGYFLTADSIANSRGKHGGKKAYLTSQLQDGNGMDTIKKLHKLGRSVGENKYRKMHGELIIKTMTTLEVLDRKNIVHGDLKWENIIGGKIADLDGLCYQNGDNVKIATPRYLPPEIPHIGAVHPSPESYKKHTSFVLGRMLLMSIDRNIDKIVHLDISKETGLLSEGYSKNTGIPKKNSRGVKFTPYEKSVIRLAYSLADTEPSDRLSVADAKEAMNGIINEHEQKNKGVIKRIFSKS